MKKEVNMIQQQQKHLSKVNPEMKNKLPRSQQQSSCLNSNRNKQKGQSDFALGKNQPNESTAFLHQQAKKQSYVMTFPYKTDPVCQPFIPISFCHSINFQEQKAFIKDKLLNGDLNPQRLIDWIETNNRRFFSYKGNCRLLEVFQFDQFIWKNVLPTMLYTVKENSSIIGKGKLRYLTKQKYGLQKMDFNRYCCYLILCQMFFGLIPPQYQHLDNAPKNMIACSFGKLMHSQSIEESGKSDGDFDLTDQQISRVHKLRALLYYFSKLQSEQIQKLTQHQTITLEYVTHHLSEQTLTDPSKIKNTNQNYSDHEDYYGTIGDQYLPELQLIEPNQILNQKQNPILKQENKHYHNLNIKEVTSFVQIDRFIDESKAQTYSQFQIVQFIFQHPQTLIAKFLMEQPLDPNSFLLITGPKKYSDCSFNHNQPFKVNSATSIQQLCNQNPKNTPQIIFMQRQTKQISIEDYSFKRLKPKIEKYVGSIKRMIKFDKQVKVVVNLGQMKHKDIYLNFLLIWVAMSFDNSKTVFAFKLQNLQKDVIYNINKFYRYFKNRQAGDILSVITGYELFFHEKGPFFNRDITQIPFIEYIKRHII